MSRTTSVTRLGNLMDFGQLFKAFGNNLFAKISHILRHFCKGVKIYHFSSEIIFGQLYLTFVDFSGHTAHYLPTYLPMSEIRRSLQIKKIPNFQPDVCPRL